MLSVTPVNPEFYGTPTSWGICEWQVYQQGVNGTLSFILAMRNHMAAQAIEVQLVLSTVCVWTCMPGGSSTSTSSNQPVYATALVQYMYTR